MKRRLESILEASGLLVTALVVLVALLFVMGMIECMFIHGANFVIGLSVIGGVVALLKYLPGCVGKIAALRGMTKTVEKQSGVKVLGFTIDKPPRALRTFDERRIP